MPALFVTVTRAEAGQKLVRFLERRVGDRAVPRSAIMRWIRKGDVRVDKGRKKPFDVVREGQIIRIPPYQDATAGHSKFKALIKPLEILFENDDVLALNKPCGLPSQGGSGHDDSVVERLKAMYGNSVFSPAPVHRLDKDTSGVLLCGKSHWGLNRLSEVFKNRKADKYYLAEVSGCFENVCWVTLKDHLEKKGKPGKAHMVTGNGKEALARVKAVSPGKTSLLLVKLLTGRTHQIRVQLASRGYPIIGDRKYGKKSSDGQMRLHCWRIDSCNVSVSCLPNWCKLDEKLLDTLVLSMD